jgi:predicted RNase H-like HicB family nuclease
LKYYNAIFRKTSDAIEVEFPDLPGCVTFGQNWEEAIDNATDVLSGWLAHARPEFAGERSSYEQIKGKYQNEAVMPIAVDDQIINSYLSGRNIKVSLPAELSRELDRMSKTKGVKRANLIREAVAEYLTKKI